MSEEHAARRRFPRIASHHTVLAKKSGSDGLEEFGRTKSMAVGGCSFVADEPFGVGAPRGADRGEWLASVKPTGVVWTKDGAHAADVPQSMQRLFQRLTIFPDPQKKEGAAQRAGDHFEFSDANSGERYVVTVKGAEIVEFRI